MKKYDMTLKDILIKCDKIKDIEFANKVYANLCNLVWYNYVEDELIDFSWRGAGGFVADIRNKLLGTNEDYLNFYCAGNEGLVDEEINQLFNSNHIVLFENFYDKVVGDMTLDEVKEIFKKKHPVVVVYNRNKQIGNIL